MKTSVWMGAAALIGMQLGAAHAVGSQKPAAAMTQSHAHWEYSGRVGPEKWAEVDEHFATCGIGKTQSPIDIRTKDVTAAALPAIEFDYKVSPLKIINNGHTIQVSYAPGSGITVGGKRYELLQFHFHHPSEEHIDGKSFDMVAHLVHKNDAGQLAVVAVLIEKGPKRPVLQAVLENLPTQKGVEQTVPGVSIDINALLPEKRSYYSFDGSLTTPPCSEGVSWMIMKQPVKASAHDLWTFTHAYPMNARPIQPRNDRPIYVSE